MLTIQFLCPLPNGLHARPAWELKEQCSQWQSEVTFINHRQIGNGPMLVLSDKSLIAPPKLTAWIETVAAEIGVPLQADMFSNGGTDGGAVHLTGTGVPTVVMGPATRHGHCAASIADCRDILQMQQLLSALIQRLTRETVVQLTDFR